MQKKPRESDSNGEEGAKGVEKDKSLQVTAEVIRKSASATISQMLKKNKYRLPPSALLPLGIYIGYISVYPSII
jgi:hypothetical protein